jgi:hypothetical protein
MTIMAKSRGISKKEKNNSLLFIYERLNVVRIYYFKIGTSYKPDSVPPSAVWRRQRQPFILSRHCCRNHASHFYPLLRSGTPILRESRRGSDAENIRVISAHRSAFHPRAVAKQWLCSCSGRGLPRLPVAGRRTG